MCRGQSLVYDAEDLVVMEVVPQSVSKHDDEIALVDIGGAALAIAGCPDGGLGCA